MKLRTAEQLSDKLSNDLAWRKKELSEVKSLVETRQFSSSKHKALIRSGVCLLYAHWEGFVKLAANSYLEYIRVQKLCYGELASNFLALAMKERLKEAKEVKNNSDDKIISILPRLPVISSINSGWQTLQLACCHEPAFSIPEHNSNYHSICINGGKVVRLEQKIEGKVNAVNSVPGDIGIYPAYLNQSFTWDKEAEFWLISLETKLISNLGYELYQTNNVELIPQLDSLFDPLIKQIALALKTTLETDGFGSPLYTDSMANALAVHLLSRYSNCSRKLKTSNSKLSQQQLSRVVDYINSNLDKEITLAKLAALLQMSEFHFGRLFKQTTGVAPHKYHLQCRIERAKNLLLQGMSIAQVAQTVGFSSQGHLNYHFKRQVGATPKQFLRQ